MRAPKMSCKPLSQAEG